MLRQNNKLWVLILTGIISFSLLLVVSACSSTATTAATTPAKPISTSPAAGQPVTVELTAVQMSFSTSTISVPAGAQVTVNFHNNDSGIPHNLALYTDSTAKTSIYVGQVITGISSVTYKFTAPATPGTYFFRCDVHANSMTGKFIVQ